MLLLDTCAVLWLAADPARLSTTARHQIAADPAHLYVSAISAFEVGLKHRKGASTWAWNPRLGGRRSSSTMDCGYCR